ncbi:hypothetical protein C0991_004297, partial [Blastosporella zonata]
YTRLDKDHMAYLHKLPEMSGARVQPSDRDREETRITERTEKSEGPSTKRDQKSQVQAHKAPPMPLEAGATETTPVPTEMGLSIQQDLSAQRGENAGEIPGQRLSGYEQSLSYTSIPTHQISSASGYALGGPSSTYYTLNHHTESMAPPPHMSAATSYNNHGASMAVGVPSPLFNFPFSSSIVGDNGSGAMSVPQFNCRYEHQIISQEMVQNSLTGQGGYQPNNNTQLM